MKKSIKKLGFCKEFFNTTIAIQINNISVLMSRWYIALAVFLSETNLNSSLPRHKDSRIVENGEYIFFSFLL